MSEVRDNTSYAAEFENVSFTYNKGISYEKKALSNVSFGIER